MQKQRQSDRAIGLYIFYSTGNHMESKVEFMQL